MTEQEIFAAAIKLSGPARAEFVKAACGENESLRRDVESLLKGHDDPGGLLPSAGVAILDPTRLHLGGAQPNDILAGRYKLLEQIGSGGMGAVWMAEQKEPVKRKVAIKLVKAGMDSAQVLARFEAERQALALMDHPNIAKVFDGGMTEQGRPFFVMEFVKGVPLTEYCNDARLSLKERLNLFIPVCQAVQHAHQKGIIHRDLKPSNILICLYDGKPVPKVIDFGLAKAMHQSLTDNTIHTAFGMMVGTPLYMSPEQAERNNLDVDTRTDIYSLGVILYELLTGTTPLEQKQLKEAAYNEILRLIKEVEPPKPSTRLSGSTSLPSVAAQRSIEPKQLQNFLAGDLDWIVMKSLEKERSRRYETANGLVRDVERFLNDEPVEASPPSRWYRLKKFARRNKTQVLAVSLVALSLIAGMIGTTLGLFEAQRQARIAKQRENGERDAKIDAQVQAKLAFEAAKKERAATELTAARLDQIDNINNTVFEIFAELDVRKFQEGREPIEYVLAKKLGEAGKKLDTKAIHDPLVLAKLRYRLGRTLVSLGQAADAIELLKSAFEIQKAELGLSHTDTLLSMNTLAIAHQEAGDLDSSLLLAEEALKITAALFGADHRNTLTAMNNLAVAYSNSGKLDLAFPLQEKAFKLRRETLGASDTDTLQSMTNLGGLYLNIGKFELAIATTKDALDLMKSEYGGSHPDVLRCMSNLASAYRRSEQLQPAIQVLVEIVDLSTAKLGARHPDTLSYVSSLAEAYVGDRKFELALPMLEETLRIQRSKLAPDHPDILQTINNTAALYFYTRKLNKSITMFEELLKLREKKFGRTHPDTQLVLMNLLVNYKIAERLDDVIPLLEEAYHSAEKNPTLRWVEPDLLEVYIRLQDSTKVKALVHRMLRETRYNFSKNSPQLSLQLVRCGWSLFQINEIAEAQELLREGLAIRDQAQPDAWNTFLTKSLLGDTLLSQEKFAEAEPLLVSGGEGLLQRQEYIPPESKFRVDEALQRVVKLYTLWHTAQPDQGYDVKASEWKDKLKKQRPTL